MLGLPPGDTDPMLDEMSDGEPDFEEPIELVEARARLAELVHAEGTEALMGEQGSMPSIWMCLVQTSWLQLPFVREHDGAMSHARVGCMHMQRDHASLQVASCKLPVAIAHAGSNHQYT